MGSEINRGSLVYGGRVQLELTRFSGHLNTWGNPPKEGVHMPRTRPPYPTEFRAEAVRLVKECGKPVSAIAREQGVSFESLRAWVRRKEVDSGLLEGLSTPDREEIYTLHQES
jgi:transposase